MPKAKDEAFQEIADQLSDIADNLDGIYEELTDIGITCKMMVFFKLIELRPEMKEKLTPMINEMAECIDFEMEKSE